MVLWGCFSVLHSSFYVLRQALSSWYHSRSVRLRRPYSTVSQPLSRDLWLVLLYQSLQIFSRIFRKFGVPKPVTASHPSVAGKPLRPVSLHPTAEPFTTSVNAA